MTMERVPVAVEPYVREIRYIHQGSTNGRGYQVVWPDTEGELMIVRETVDRESAEEFALAIRKRLRWDRVAPPPPVAPLRVGVATES